MIVILVKAKKGNLPSSVFGASNSMATGKLDQVVDQTETLFLTVLVAMCIEELSGKG